MILYLIISFLKDFL